jgi:Trk K+ transport system NAD-binding subunit
VRSIRDSVRIGFAGLGRMGAPMCANLVRAGRTVATTDIRPEAAVAGARPLPGMADLAAEDTYRRALDRFGPVDGELLAVALLEAHAGRPLRHPYEN